MGYPIGIGKIDITKKTDEKDLELKISRR